MATVKPAWLASVEHVLSNACSTIDRTIWIACSGGLDSCVLLDIAAQWAGRNADNSVAVIHINHQLSPNADNWQKQVEQLAFRYQIRCVSKKVSVANDTRQSLESQARDARYESIFKTLNHDDVLLLGHHLDDQVETVLLRLLRGSGPKGLGAIRASTQRQYGQKSINLIRPLLSVQRSDLESYARDRSLAWIDDESNESLDFDRNVLRHRWLKPAEKLWPVRWTGMKKAIARSADLCEQQQSALDFLLADKLSEIQTSPQTISRSALIAQAPVLRMELVRHWLSGMTKTLPSAAVLEQVIWAVTSAADKSPIVQWGTHELRVHSNSVYFLQHAYQPQSISAELSNDGCFLIQDALGNHHHLGGRIIDGNLELALDDEQGKGILQSLELPNDSVKINSISLASDIGAHYFSEDAKGKPRQLKRWFKEWKTPPWYRTNVIGIFLNDALIAVVDGKMIRPNYAG